jgi:hypothetical protein
LRLSRSVNYIEKPYLVSLASSVFDGWPTS